MSADQISLITSIVLTVLFVLAIGATVIASIIGFKNGVWRASHRMLILAALIVVAVCTLEPMAKFIGSLPIDWFGFKTVCLSKTLSDGTVVNYYVPITSAFETVKGVFAGYYSLFGVIGNSAVASATAIAVASTVIKWATFFIDAILIVTLGGILEIILWHAAAKHFIPSLVRKTVKLPWLSMIQNAVVFLVSGFLFFSPFSSLVNAVNQGYHNKEHDQNNQIVALVGSFLDTYNNSLFAKTFVNWTTNDSGLTLDAAAINLITSSAVSNGSFGIIQSIESLTEITSYLIDGVSASENGAVTISTDVILSVETIMGLFDAIRNSGLLTTIVPIAAELASNEALLAKMNLQGLGLSDIEWAKEVDNAETIALDIINSGMLDKIVDEDGKPNLSPSAFIDNFLKSSKVYSKVQHALSIIDDSKLLSRAIPSLISFVISTNDEIASYFPSSWDELNDISWGFELSTVLDCAHDMYLVNPEMLQKALDYISGGSQSDPTPEPSGLKRDPEPTPDADPDSDPQSDLIELIIKDINSYKTIIVGKTDGNNNITNIDDYGRTIIYKDGQKVKDAKYCLMDLELAKTLITPIFNILTSQGKSNSSAMSLRAEGKTIAERVKEVASKLMKGVWRKNFKEEFNAIFYALEVFSGHADTLQKIFSGASILPDSGKLTDLDPEISKILAKTLPRVDKSELLSEILYPMCSDLLLSSATQEIFEDLEIDVDLLKHGVEICQEERTFGYELSKIIRPINSISNILECLSKTSSSDILQSIGECAEDIAYVLDAFHSSKIVNITRDEKMKFDTKTYRVNANYYNMLSYVFGSALTVEGFSFKEDEILPSTVWENGKNSEGEFYRDRYGNPIFTGENGNIANVIRVIGKSNITSIFDDPNFFTDNKNFEKLADPNLYNLPGILKAVDKSQVFSATMGDFLDASLKDIHITGEAGVTFNNVTSWSKEADALSDILKTIGKVTVDLNNLDLTAIDDIVGLNNVFHSLLESSIFVSKVTGEFLFPDWLFTKFSSQATGMTKLYGEYDLLKDPSVPYYSDETTGTVDPRWVDWTNYDNYREPAESTKDYKIFYNDMVSLNNKDAWYSTSFDDTDEAKAMNNPARYGTEYWNRTDFYDQYKVVMHKDELGRLCELLYWARKAMSGVDSPIDMSSDVFGHLLDTMNSTTVLRIGIYNLYEIAKEAISDKPNVKKYFDFDPAYSTYAINCDYQSMSLFDESREKRQIEIEYLKNVYQAYRLMVEMDILDMVTGDFKPDNITLEFTEHLKKTAKGLNESLIMHRKGSIFFDPEHPDEYKPTAFQNMLSAFFLKTDFKDIIYNENNPKDVYYTTIEPIYEANVESKVEYIFNSYFNWRWADGTHNPEVEFEKQQKEIDRIFEVLNCIAGGVREDGKKYYGLKKDDGKTTFSFDNFDITNVDNIEAIKQTLTALNATETLYDGVPNAIEIAFSSSAITDNFSTLDKLKLSDANLFYHYFDVSSTSSLKYKWTAKLSDENTPNVTGEDDISFITSLLTEASLYCSDKPGDKESSVISCFEDFSIANIPVLRDFLNNMLTSKIFHSSGLKKTINASGDVITVPTSTQTVFQGVIQQFLSADHIKREIYNIHNPKDALYEDVDEKITEISKTVFPLNTPSLAYQLKEIKNLCDFLEYAQTYGTTNMGDINFSDPDLKTDELFDVLYALNNSECLYDCVPNILYSTFQGCSFDKLGSVDLKNAEVFYLYTEQSSLPDYTKRYSEEEINTLSMIVTDYQGMVDCIGNDDLTDLFVIEQLVNQNHLFNILKDMHNSKMMHLCNSRKGVDGNLTVFEETIYFIVHSSGLDEYTYGASDAETMMKAKIENVTYLEVTNPHIDDLDCYHNEWLAKNEFDELHSFIKFIKTGQEFLGTSGDLSFDSMSFGQTDPQKIGNLMKAINDVDFLSDALPVFVRKGFEDVGMDDLTKFNGVSYAKYDFTQREYGEVIDHGSVAGSEIDLITDALENLYLRTATTGTYLSMSNVVTFSQSVSSFDGVMEFAQFSRILNTSQAGVYNEMNTISTATTPQKISARGVLMYNIFNSSGANPEDGAHMSKYITGANDGEKIGLLSKIFTFTQGYDYRYESAGVLALARNSTAIDESKEVFGNFSKFAEVGKEISELLTTSYNADGNLNRSYFASQVVAGFLDETVSAQCDKISKPVPINYAPTSVAENASNIVETTYANVNRTESEGVRNTVEFFNMFNDYQHGVKPTRNEFIIALSKLDGSTFAKVIWTSEIASNLPAPVSSIDVFADGFLFSDSANTIAIALGL